MSQIRCIHHGAAPAFPATDQHPDAKRIGPIEIGPGDMVYVDFIGKAPSLEQIVAVLNPPPAPTPTIEQKLAAAGLTIPELKQALGL